MKMQSLIILRGISGAGKSTFTEVLKIIVPTLVHCSADFIHLDSEGVYRFDPSKLADGHGLCFRTAVEALQRGERLVVVDNTHTQNWEMAPYVQAGRAYGYKTGIVRLDIDAITAAQRNVHGVALGHVKNMEKRFEDPMKFWPREYRFSNPSEDEVLDFFMEFEG